MKRASLVTVIVFVAYVFGFTGLDLAKKPTAISVAERRKLAQPPTLSLGALTDGSFSADYASFLQDQVVFRDGLRAIKAFAELKLLRKHENNGVYVVGNNIYDKFYGTNQRYIDRAPLLINEIIGSIDSASMYLSIIPSKAHALDRSTYPLSDQGAIADDIRQRTNATYIDLVALFGPGSAGLYYRTDHHWTTYGAMRAYETLIQAMGQEPLADYDFEELTDAFVGSNYGRAALGSIGKDAIYLAHNQVLDTMRVCRYEAADAIACYDSVYFREKVDGLDPYDVFLGGAGPVIIIENSRAPSDAELVVFKDSYAHVLAPFLAQHFRRVTLFDLRYVRRQWIFDNFELDGKVVLFLYSTTILNTDPKILN